MANYATLISAIQTTIAANGNNEITGSILQQTLLAIVNSLGANCQFVGVANESTNPGTPDQNVVYIAGSGTYPNFNSAVVPSGYLGVFKYNGSWVVQTVAVGKDYDEAITALQKNKVDKRAGKNLFDPNADGIMEYHYISSAGSTPCALSLARSPPPPPNWRSAAAPRAMSVLSPWPDRSARRLMR